MLRVTRKGEGGGESGGEGGGGNGSGGNGSGGVLTTEVLFGVWAPQQISILVSDGTLQRIGTRQASGSVARHNAPKRNERPSQSSLWLELWLLYIHAYAHPCQRSPCSTPPVSERCSSVVLYYK